MATTENKGDAGAQEMPQWLVQPEQARLWVDAFHILHMSVGDKEYTDLHARLVFPLSNMVDYVSLLDEKDKEVALLARPHKLDKASRAALEKALDRMYYVAKILRIDEIKETMGVTHWQVQTDRGYAAFEVVDLHHVRKLPNGRYLIADADGNRFEIEDIQRLDSRSQKLVQSEV
jgi:hypothetical protein